MNTPNPANYTGHMGEALWLVAVLKDDAGRVAEIDEDGKLAVLKTMLGRLERLESVLKERDR